MKNFEKELTELLNYYNIDSYLRLPDFLIAEYLMKTLYALNALQAGVDAWTPNFNTNHFSQNAQLDANLKRLINEIPYGGDRA